MNTPDDSWAKRFNAYGALFVTVAVFLLLFLGMVIAAKEADLPPAFSTLMETVKALALLCAGYWVGSSKSSQDKDATIAAAVPVLAASPPPVAGGTPP